MQSVCEELLGWRKRDFPYQSFDDAKTVLYVMSVDGRMKVAAFSKAKWK